jgi:hypothetical protein
MLVMLNRSVLPSVASMAAMAAMHEHVQEGAGEKDQKRKCVHHVSAMFGDQIEASDGSECREHPARASLPLTLHCRTWH